VSSKFVRLTEAASANDAEWFAETFAAWVLDRAALLKIDPDAVRFIDEMIAKASRAKPSHLGG
jgi:hypothetical protein